MNHRKAFWATLTTALFLVCVPAKANITFNINYTTAVQANANFASIQSGVNYVANEYSTLYGDNITLNFTVDQNSSGLGSSLFSNSYWRGGYAALVAALTADSKTSNDATAVANLPVADPYSDQCGSANNCWYAPSAEAKALGLLANQALFDGTFTFNSTQPYTFDPSNRAVAGEFDFIGTTEHEFAELMGRTSQAASFGYNILDTMRFTAPGVLQPGQASGVYFSFNNGNTNLAGYNAGAGDRQDFNGTVATDPYNASTSTNQGHILNAVDKSLMDVIGFNLAVPEPSTFVLTGLALAAVLWKRHQLCRRQA